MKFRKGLAVRAVVDGGTDTLDSLERCFRASPTSDSPASSSSASPVMYAPVMKGGKYSSLGAVTLEKSKLDLSSKQKSKSSPEVFHSFFLSLNYFLFSL